MEAPSTSSLLLRPWSDLLPELLGHVIALLPFPADRARFRAVCRGWRSAARHHVRQLPWLVLPDGSFCTIGDDGGAFFPRGTIPGVPDDATCVGSTGAWLALDRTDDVYRRIKLRDALLLRRSAYQATPAAASTTGTRTSCTTRFSGETVPLPELDAVIGHVSERFEVRKVLMRSSTGPDDVIAVVTNSYQCNVILCRPGKGTDTLHHFGVCDVAFLEDCLYGIIADEDLLVFHLDEDDDGRPIVIFGKRVIKHPLADGEEDPWSWMDEDHDDDNDGGDSDGSGSDNDEGPDDQEEEGDRFKGDDTVLDGKDIGPYTEEPYQGHAITTRKLMVSQAGELLMVRRLMQQPPFTSSFTREVNVLKVDMDMGKWIPVTHDDALAQDEALFLGGAFSKCSKVFGDMELGYMYFNDADEVFDTRLWTTMPFTIPWQKEVFSTDWTTWVFPPEVVV